MVGGGGGAAFRFSPVTPVTPSVTPSVNGEGELGPDAQKAAPFTLVHSESHLRTEVAELQPGFTDVFSPLPGRTTLIEHRIETPHGVSVRSWPYRLPKHERKIVKDELKVGRNRRVA